MRCANCGANNPIEARFCGDCGRPLEPEPRRCSGCGMLANPADRYCRNCGQDVGGDLSSPRFESVNPPPTELQRPTQTAEPAAAPSPELANRQRPVWLVSTLCLVSLGLYTPVWLGLTWWEIQKSQNRPDFFPLWHGLTFFAPVYQWFRFHAHYRVINELLVGAGAAPIISPITAVMGFVLFQIAGLVVNGLTTASDFTILVIMLAGASTLAAVLASGQRGLNAYWQLRSPEPLQEQPHWGELLGLAVGGLFFLLLIVSLLAAPEGTAANGV